MTQLEYLGHELGHFLDQRATWAQARIIAARDRTQFATEADYFAWREAQALYPEGRRVLGMVDPALRNLMVAAENAGVWALPPDYPGQRLPGAGGGDD